MAADAVFFLHRHMNAVLIKPTQRDTWWTLSNGGCIIYNYNIYSQDERDATLKSEADRRA